MHRLQASRLVPLGYLAVSFAYYGQLVLPHPGRVFLGSSNDPLIFIWSFAWYPHALAHAINPFVTKAIFAPQGIDLAWTTSTPALALAFAPVTAAFGPVVSYNLAIFLLPALGAWTAYLLCRYLTRSTWASFVGGYLFGFSSYVLGQQTQGHIHLTANFLLPLIALVVVRFVRGESTARRLAIYLALLVAGQLLISTEVALSATIALALGLLLALALVPDARSRVRASIVPVIAGYGLAAVLAAPFLYFVLSGLQSGDFTNAGASGSDLAGIAVPSTLNWLEGSVFRSLSASFKVAESGLFLGLPSLLIIALFAWRQRRSATARFLMAALVLAVLLTLGPVLRVDDHRVATLPVTLVRHLPVTDNIAFQRFAVYVSLAAAVIVAIWASRARTVAAYALPALAMLALVPTLPHDVAVVRPPRWSFFTAGLDTSCVRRGQTLMVFPFGPGGDSMLWQAESGFRFNLAEGYMFPLVFGARHLTAFEDDPIGFNLLVPGVGIPTTDSLLGFASEHHVARLVTAGSSYPDAEQMRAFGPIERIGGVTIAPACGAPPLTSRNLTSVVARMRHRAYVNVLYCTGGGSYELPATFSPANMDGTFRANYVAGEGLTCSAPPPRDKRDGFAPITLGVPAGTYPYYTAGRGASGGKA